MSEELKNRKEKLLSIFKDKFNILVLLVILFAIVIRLYYLFLANSQTLWWDEAELMLQAKHLAFGTPNTGWFPYREPLLPIIWSFFFKLGSSESFIRFIEIIFSIIAIIFTYLLGKEIFDKKVALIATTFLSFFYLHLFYSLRFMSEAPTLAFVTMTIYFFWKGYFNKAGLKYLIAAGLSFAIGFLSYYAVGFLVLIFLILLIIVDKIKFLKRKDLWVATIIILLIISPYIIHSLIKFKTPIPRLYAVKASITEPTTTKVYSAWTYYINLLPNYLQNVLLVVFLLGFLYLLINIILGFDLIIKNKEEELKKDLLLFLWIIIPIIILSYIAINTGGHGEDRYIMLIFPAVFLVASKFIIKISEYINKISNNKIAIAFIILIIVIVGFQQIKAADSLIKSKLASYEPVKASGLWIKQNSLSNDVIISNSIPQNTYYSERATYYSADAEKIKSYKPRYLVWSVFESSGNPNSDYTNYIRTHESQLTPVQAYFADKEQKQPLLIIFEFKS